MKKPLLALLFVTSLIAACGSDGGVNSDSTTNDGVVVDTTPPGNGDTGNGNGNGKGDTGVAPQSDSGTSGGQDSGSTTDQDSGSTDTDGGTTDQDGGTTTGGDSGSGGGDQDGGTTTGGDSGSGGGDQDGGVTTGGDSGTGCGGGGDQDSGSTGGGTDSGTGGGGDQDSGTGGGGGTDSGTGGGGGQDAGTGGDSGGSCGHDESCTPHSCTHTQGYYKNHTSSVTGLTLGGVSYTQSEVLGFLNATPNGDDSLILAKQLIAALLNGGACDCNAATTVQAAQDWMAANKDADGTLPYGTMCVLSTDPGCTAYSLGQTLDSYNSGLSGTPHCE